MPTVDIYSKQQVDALIAGAGGLPDPTSASAGDVLTLDSNKDPAWVAIPDELPTTGSASAGDILTLDSNKDPAWVAPSGGRTKVNITSLQDFQTFITNAHHGDELIGYYMSSTTTGSSNLKTMGLFKLTVIEQANPATKVITGYANEVTGFNLTTTFYPVKTVNGTLGNGTITGMRFHVTSSTSTPTITQYANITFAPNNFVNVIGIHY